MSTETGLDAEGLDAYRREVSRLLAERDALKAAIADVRRLCDMTIATSCRVQAIDQATDTIAVLDRALAAPETPGDAPAKPKHIGGRANAEDCPACHGTNPPWPFICPGEPEPPGDAGTEDRS